MAGRQDSPVPYDKQVGFWRSIVRQVQLVFRLMGDQRVPFWTKSIPILSIAYLVWPADLIPGAIAPVLGAMDDLAAVLLGFKIFVELCPPEVVREHQALLASAGINDGDVVEGEVRPVDDNAEPSTGPVIDIDS